VEEDFTEESNYRKEKKKRGKWSGLDREKEDGKDTLMAAAKRAITQREGGEIHKTKAYPCQREKGKEEGI